MSTRMSEAQTVQRHISFHFHPRGFDEMSHAVEKSDDGGAKRRYLKGISSGLRVDAHGERMTKNAIDSFMEQANSGDILLYADLHGIRFTDDIGILTKAEVLDGGDWATEYRLYDDQDGVDQVSVQRADKLWKQIMGLPPYKHPRQKGFSVEGFVPDDQLVKMGKDGREAIDGVTLDGVVVVPRPAYQDSVAHAVYKALGVVAPWEQDGTIAGRLRRVAQESEERDSYYRQKLQVDDALETLVQEAMSDPDPTSRRERLEQIFGEYQGLMIDLIMSNPNAFSADEISLDQGPVEAKVAKSNLLKGLVASLTDLEKFYEVGDTA